MSLWPATSGCLVMVLAVVSVKRAFLGGAPAYASLIINMAVGTTAYLVTLLTFHQDRIRTLRGMLSVMRSGPDAVSVGSDLVASRPMIVPATTVMINDAVVVK